MPDLTDRTDHTELPAEPYKPKYNLTPDEAIAEMVVQLEKMRAEPDREQLKDILSDDAYELGYETALFDYLHLTGPDPREVGVIIYTKPKETDGE